MECYIVTMVSDTTGDATWNNVTIQPIKKWYLYDVTVIFSYIRWCSYEKSDFHLKIIEIYKMWLNTYMFRKIHMKSYLYTKINVNDDTNTFIMQDSKFQFEISLCSISRFYKTGCLEHILYNTGCPECIFYNICVWNSYCKISRTNIYRMSRTYT